MDAAPRHAANSVCSGTLTIGRAWCAGGLSAQRQLVRWLRMWPLADESGDKRSGNCFDVAAQRIAGRVVAWVDLGQHDGGQRGRGEQNRQDLSCDGEWDTRAVMREVGEWQVPGVDGVDVEMDDQPLGLLNRSEDAMGTAEGVGAHRPV